jgi:hypothetical protein
MQRGEKLELRHDVDVLSVLSWVNPGALHIIEEVRGSQCQEALALLLLAAVVNIACCMSGTCSVPAADRAGVCCAVPLLAYMHQMMHAHI